MSNSTRNLHVWKTRTADGLKREVRAKLFAKKWSLSSRCKGEQDWTEHEKPLIEDLEELEAVLQRKYERKHLAWEHLVSVRELIAARRVPKS